MATELPTYTFTPLTLPGIAAVPQPEDINNRGDIVGNYHDASGGHGFLLRGGQVTTLDAPGGIGSMSIGGINDAGDIVGFYLAESGSSLAESGFSLVGHGFLYRDGMFTTLDIPGAGDTNLTGINDRGQIVAFATARDAASPSGGFVYENGAFTKITVPGFPDAFVSPQDINDNGAITGTGISVNSGFVLDAGHLTLLHYPSTTSNTQAFAINNEGQVVGEGSAGRAVTVGFTYKNGEYVALNPPMPPPPPDRPPATELTGINDAGEIVGTDTGGGFGIPPAPFIATPHPPVPQPAVVNWDALAAQVEANFAATGQWFVSGLPPPEQHVDWNALAAQVEANFAATGQWFA